MSEMSEQLPPQEPNQAPEQKPIFFDARMMRLRRQQSREANAHYEAFFIQYPQFKNEAYEDDTSPEFEAQYRAYMNESVIIERHAAERRQLAAEIRAERAAQPFTNE